MKRLFGLALLIISLAGVITGCNTVEGIGKDIQSGGEAIEELGK